MWSRTIIQTSRSVDALGAMEFQLGNERRVCHKGDVLVVPGGAEHEASFREDTEVIDFFAPPRDDFLAGGRPSYMSDG